MLEVSADARMGQAACGGSTGARVRDPSGFDNLRDGD